MKKIVLLSFLFVFSYAAPAFSTDSYFLNCLKFSMPTRVTLESKDFIGGEVIDNERKELGKGYSKSYKDKRSFCQLTFEIYDFNTIAVVKKDAKGKKEYGFVKTSNNPIHPDILLMETKRAYADIAYHDLNLTPRVVEQIEINKGGNVFSAFGKTIHTTEMVSVSDFKKHFIKLHTTCEDATSMQYLLKLTESGMNLFEESLQQCTKQDK